MACSCVWALPGAKKTTEVKQKTEVLPEQQETSTSVESPSLSQSETTGTSTDLDELLTLLEKNNYILGAEKIDTVKKAIEDVSADIGVSNALIEAQMSQIEALKKELASTRFFADLGVAFGFKDVGVNYGVVGDMGIKFGNGLLTKVGVQYMVGDFKSLPQWSIENMTVSATIGWEW